MRWSALVLAALVFAGCGKDEASPAPTPVVPACQANNTAQVRFDNRSASSTTYVIIWNGSAITTLGPGETSQYYTVAAGVQHSLGFMIANTTRAACATSKPVVAQCSGGTFWCAY